MTFCVLLLSFFLERHLTATTAPHLDIIKGVGGATVLVYGEHRKVFGSVRVRIFDEGITKAVLLYAFGLMVSSIYKVTGSVDDSWITRQLEESENKKKIVQNMREAIHGFNELHLVKHEI